MSLSLKCQSRQDVDFRHESNILITPKDQINKDEYEYKDAVNNLNAINSIIKTANDHATCKNSRTVNKYKFISTGMNIFKEWMKVLNNPVIKFAARRYYDDDNIVRKTIKNQKDYYPEHKYKLHEGNKPPL